MREASQGEASQGARTRSQLFSFSRSVSLIASDTRGEQGRGEPGISRALSIVLRVGAKLRYARRAYRAIREASQGEASQGGRARSEFA